MDVLALSLTKPWERATNPGSAQHRIQDCCKFGKIEAQLQFDVTLVAVGIACLCVTSRYLTLLANLLSITSHSSLEKRLSLALLDTKAGFPLGIALLPCELPIPSLI